MTAEDVESGSGTRVEDSGALPLQVEMRAREYGRLRSVAAAGGGYSPPGWNDFVGTSRLMVRLGWSDFVGTSRLGHFNTSGHGGTLAAPEANLVVTKMVSEADSEVVRNVTVAVSSRAVTDGGRRTGGGGRRSGGD